MKPGYRRRLSGAYSFRAYIDEHGCNKNLEHARLCPPSADVVACMRVAYGVRCPHRKLWDFNTAASRNVLRIIWSRHGLHAVLVGPRYWGWGR
jgi:hypothetical protein